MLETLNAYIAFGGKFFCLFDTSIATNVVVVENVKSSRLKL